MERHSLQTFRGCFGKSNRNSRHFPGFSQPSAPAPRCCATHALDMAPLSQLELVVESIVEILRACRLSASTPSTNSSFFRSRSLARAPAGGKHPAPSKQHPRSGPGYSTGLAVRRPCLANYLGRAWNVTAGCAPIGGGQLGCCIGRYAGARLPVRLAVESALAAMGCRPAVLQCAQEHTFPCDTADSSFAARGGRLEVYITCPPRAHQSQLNGGRKQARQARGCANVAI